MEDERYEETAIEARRRAPRPMCQISARKRSILHDTGACRGETVLARIDVAVGVGDEVSQFRQRPRRMRSKAASARVRAPQGKRSSELGHAGRLGRGPEACPRQPIRRGLPPPPRSLAKQGGRRRQIRPHSHGESTTAADSFASTWIDAMQAEICLDRALPGRGGM